MSKERCKHCGGIHEEKYHEEAKQVVQLVDSIHRLCNEADSLTIVFSALYSVLVETVVKLKLEPDLEIAAFAKSLSIGTQRDAKMLILRALMRKEIL